MFMNVPDLQLLRLKTRAPPPSITLGLGASIVLQRLSAYLVHHQEHLFDPYLPWVNLVEALMMLVVVMISFLHIWANLMKTGLLCRPKAVSVCLFFLVPHKHLFA